MTCNNTRSNQAELHLTIVRWLELNQRPRGLQPKEVFAVNVTLISWHRI